MRVRAAGVLCAAVALLVAGCGGGSSSNGEAKKAPEQVLKDAKAAALAATAVHVVGHIVSGGSPLGIDMTLNRGKGGKGTLTESGVSFQLIRIGDKAFVKGSDAFYEKFAGSAAALLKGKWLEGSATKGEFGTLGQLTDLGKLLDQVSSPKNHGKLANDGETTYKGQKVDVLRDTSDGSKLYVAATGKPYPVAIVGGKSGQKGTVTFGGWNETVQLVAPSGAIDLAKLGTG